MFRYLYIICKSEIDIQKQNKEEIQTIQETCEDDWVIVSEYNIFTNGYKTYSKCSKCGNFL